MKTSKQDIQDLLSQLAADIEEIKTQLAGGAAGVGAATGASGKANASSYTAATDRTATSNGVANTNPDRIIAEINRVLEPIAQTCGKLPGRLKSYHVQLWKHIVSDIREELNSESATRKRKCSPTVEGKIDNSLTMLISIYDRLNQLEYALRPNTPNNGQSGREQAANGKSVHNKSAKSGIISVIKSAWSGVQRLRLKRKSRWYRNPYILCAVGIYLLYFALSIVSWQQWHHYRDENARLRLTADKYYVDSVILHEIYPQAAITLSAYEHITESDGADTAIEVFRDNLKKINKQKTSSTR